MSDKLREALLRYGEHDKTCASEREMSPPRGFERNPCSCGFDSVRNAALAEPSEVEQLKAELAACREKAKQLHEAIQPLSSCYLPPSGYEHLGVTAHFKIEQVRAAIDAAGKP